MGFIIIKDILRKNLYTRYILNEYHWVAGNFIPKIIPDEVAVKRYFKKRSGRDLDVKNPITFSEKQQFLKLNDKNPLMKKCADKYTVREYISNCGLSELLNELIDIYEEVNQIDINKLPNQFVLKATHGSGFNLIVKNKKDVNWPIWRAIMRSWLRQNIYWSGREWVYKDLKPRIIAEKYLEDESGELRDYKFFCFNGEPRFMQLEVGRYTDHNTRNFYDMEWNIMPFGKEVPHNPNIIVDKPYAFDEMKNIARKLCVQFSFVRVDLYQVGGKVYFGELTFFPAGGAPDFIPLEYDRIVGDMWKL